MHDTLARNGYSVAANADILRGGKTNIDLLVSDKKVEVKSPQARYTKSAKDPFRFVQHNVAKAEKQFNQDGESRKRMVLSNYYTDYVGEQEEEALTRFAHEVTRSQFTDAWFIMKNGQLKKVI
ncbi:hypothetical protein [Fannyhessea vaginae]|uniref:hypothetical protein n=1 Tax=Fannyhessea vaginae TaxID=82135 RepID=UPI003A806BDF